MDSPLSTQSIRMKKTIRDRLTKKQMNKRKQLSKPSTFHGRVLSSIVKHDLNAFISLSVPPKYHCECFEKCLECDSFEIANFILYNAKEACPFNHYLLLCTLFGCRGTIEKYNNCYDRLIRENIHQAPFANPMIDDRMRQVALFTLLKYVEHISDSQLLQWLYQNILSVDEELYQKAVDEAYNEKHIWVWGVLVSYKIDV
jgi:hypothetical protein